MDPTKLTTLESPSLRTHIKMLWLPLVFILVDNSVVELGPADRYRDQMAVVLVHCECVCMYKHSRFGGHKQVRQAQVLTEFYFDIKLRPLCDQLTTLPHLPPSPVINSDSNPPVKCSGQELKRSGALWTDSLTQQLGPATCMPILCGLFSLVRLGR